MGRPPLSPDTDTVVLSIRLPRTWLGRIEREITRRGQGETRSEFLRYCLQRRLITDHSALEALDALFERRSSWDANR